VRDEALPLGVFANSGKAMGAPSEADFAALALRVQPAKPPMAGPHLGATSEVDAQDLADAGWGIIFGASVSADIRARLEPLISARRKEASSRQERRFRIFADASAPRKDESAAAWVGRHGAAIGFPVDPDKGVPYYLLIVASPEEISFEFQYALDMDWAVGRLWFDASEDFSRYAQKLCEYERRSDLLTPRFVVFAPEHELDDATTRFVSGVAEPLSADSGRGPLGGSLNYLLEPRLGFRATKAELASLLVGAARPSVLFTGGHGVACEFNGPDDSARQRAIQGALVCADWPNAGVLDESHWFGAGDLDSAADLSGLIHFCFACYGGGVPESDDFSQVDRAPRRIAERPFIALLPQKLLAQGALAVVAHVDRAWSYSFKSMNGGTQEQGFRDALYRILRGDRLGDALDAFNVKWTKLTADLHPVFVRWNNGEPGNERDLANLLVAAHDARNYIVLGDPAVRARRKPVA